MAPEAATYAGEQLGIDPSSVDLSTIQAEAEQLLRQTGDPDLQPGALAADADAAQDAARDQAESGDVRGAIQTAFGRADGVVREVDRQDLVNVVAARTGQSEAEARQTVAGWENQLTDLRQTVSTEADSLREGAVSVAEDATDFLGTSALIGFLALVLGAAAAGFGGGAGSPAPLPEHAFRRD